MVPGSDVAAAVAELWLSEDVCWALNDKAVLRAVYYDRNDMWTVVRDVPEVDPELIKGLFDAITAGREAEAKLKAIEAKLAAEPAQAAHGDQATDVLPASQDVQ